MVFIIGGSFIIGKILKTKRYFVNVLHLSKLNECRIYEHGKYFRMNDYTDLIFFT